MIIAVCGQKGGTGKTTTAYSIAAEMVSRGRKVLLVDADPQGSARTWVRFPFWP
jgi:chromosome partitioning protein